MIFGNTHRLMRTRRADTQPRDLEGVRVLEVGSFVAGPYAGVLLADMGAEVIKIEDPQGGDAYRGLQPGVETPQFCAYNRGKKSVTLNLRTAEARDLFYRLCRKVDVVIENHRPGMMEKLGLHYEKLRTLNRRLIYCSITGMGATGPYAHRPAFDTVGQALGGLLSLLTDRERPRPVGPHFSDSLAGLFGAIAVLGALHSREKNGLGQQVGTSIVAATLSFLNAPATDYLATGELPGPDTRARFSQSYLFVCGDNRGIAVHLSLLPKFWAGLCRAIDRPDLLEDPRFRNPKDRRQNYVGLQQALEPVFRAKPRQYWQERLDHEDVPHAPIYDMGELFEDPHIRHMGMAIQIPRPGRQPIRTVRFPIDHANQPSVAPGPPPGLGEHTAEILGALRVGRKTLADFKRRGVI